MKIWASRFQQDITDQTLDYTQTVDVDARMLSADLRGSMAHVLMLCQQGIVAAADSRKLIKSLLALTDKAERGEFALDREKEDVHLNVESALIAELGMEVGGKLHTARSRNDQVVTDARLYLREQILELGMATTRFGEALLVQADGHVETLMLGYTHSQAAQPISFGFWLAAHSSVLLRDIRRLIHAFETVNENPLGSCALAGTSFPIDRELTTRLLGFDRTLLHALDATSSRDFLEETAAAAVMLMAHLSRLGEEIVVWSSFEYRLFEVADQFATGSSIMPQKKNPVVAELARARCGTTLGAFVELMTVVKSVTMGYSSDLQQDKPPVWRAMDTTLATVKILHAQMTSLRFDSAQAEASCWKTFATATDLANALVTRANLPFREAYGIVGALVKEFSVRGLTLADTSEVRAFLARNGVELPEVAISEAVDPRHVLRRQTSEGSTGPAALARTLSALKQEYGRSSALLNSKAAAIQAALDQTREIAANFAAGADLGPLLARP